VRGEVLESVSSEPVAVTRVVSAKRDSSNEAVPPFHSAISMQAPSFG
jgi:hypothetical protein